MKKFFLYITVGLFLGPLFHYRPPVDQSEPSIHRTIYRVTTTTLDYPTFQEPGFCFSQYCLLGTIL